VIVSTTLDADTQLTHGLGAPGRAWVQADGLAVSATIDDLERVAAEFLAAANAARAAL